MDNDVDAALNGDPLINVQIDYHSMREVLSELSVQLDRANHEITELQQHKELEEISQRLDQMEDNIQEIGNSRVAKTEEVPEGSIEQLHESLDKQISDLKHSFDKMLDNMKTETLNDLEKKLNDEREQRRLEMSQIPTLEMFGSILDRLTEIESKPVYEEKKGGRGSKTHSSRDKSGRGAVPAEVSQQGQGPINASIEYLKKKLVSIESSGEENSKNIEDMSRSIQQNADMMDNLDQLRQALNERVNEMRIDHSERLLKLENLEPVEKPVDVDVASLTRIIGASVLEHVMPEIEKLKQENQQMRETIDEQNKVISELREKPATPPHSQQHVRQVVFQICQNQEHHVPEKMQDSMGVETPEVITPHEAVSASILSPMRSPRGVVSLDLKGRTSIQGTPRDHQSFKELSRHINDTNERISNLETTIKDLDERINGLKDESLHNTEVLQIIQQQQETARSMGVSAIPQPDSVETPESVREPEVEAEAAPEVEKNVMEVSESPVIVTVDIPVKEEDQASKVDDFTLDDIGNLIEDVRELKEKVISLEQAGVMVPREPEVRVEIRNDDGTRESITYRDVMMQTLEECACQVIMTEDIGVDPEPLPSPEKVETPPVEEEEAVPEEPEESAPEEVPEEPAKPVETEEPSQVKIILPEADAVSIESARLESDPEMGLQKEGEMELRISTPVFEDVGSRKSTTRSPVRSPTLHRSASMQKGMDDLESSIKEINSKYEALQDQLNAIGKEIRAPKPKSPVKIDMEPIMEELRQEIDQLRTEVEQRLLGLTPEVIQEMGTYAPLPVVKKIAVNFHTAVDNLEKQISSIKDFLRNLVSKNDLEAMMEQIQTDKAQGETAGGRNGIHCLLCGKPANSVTGMITESDVARLLGTPPQCGVTKTRESAYVLSYGKDTLRPKKRTSLKAALPPMNPPVNIQ